MHCTDAAEKKRNHFPGMSLWRSQGRHHQVLQQYLRNSLLIKTASFVHIYSYFVSSEDFACCSPVKIFVDVFGFVECRWKNVGALSVLSRCRIVPSAFWLKNARFGCYRDLLQACFHLWCSKHIKHEFLGSGPGFLLLWRQETPIGARKSACVLRMKSLSPPLHIACAHVRAKTQMREWMTLTLVNPVVHIPKLKPPVNFNSLGQGGTVSSG